MQCNCLVEATSMTTRYVLVQELLPQFALYSSIYLHCILQDWEPEFLVYGDLGVHSESIPLLNQEAMKGMYTAILHIGDFAYNLEQTVQDGPHFGENVSAHS